MSPRSTSPKIAVSKKQTKVSQDILLSGLAYITVIGWLIAYFSPKLIQKESTMFHIRQSFGIHMTVLVCEMLVTFSMIPYFMIHVVWLFYIIAMIVLSIQAWRGKNTKFILLGDKFQQWFLFL